MRYKRIHIIVKPTDKKKYPKLYNDMPYASRVGNNTEWTYKRREEVIENIAQYLVHNPYKFIVLKNKLPEKEKALGKTLDSLVKDHNTALEKQDLILKLGVGGKHRCLRRAKKFLREMAGE
jgi:hypothetical protein